MEWHSIDRFIAKWYDRREERGFVLGLICMTYIFMSCPGIRNSWAASLKWHSTRQLISLLVTDVNRVLDEGSNRDYWWRSFAGHSHCYPGTFSHLQYYRHESVCTSSSVYWIYLLIYNWLTCLKELLDWLPTTRLCGAVHVIWSLWRVLDDRYGVVLWLYCPCLEKLWILRSYFLIKSNLIDIRTCQITMKLNIPTPKENFYFSL